MIYINKHLHSLIQKPILLWIVIVVLLSLLSIIGYPIYYLFSNSTSGELYAEGVVKLLIFGVFLLIVRELKWFKSTGLSNIGDKKIWVITIFVLMYLLPTKLYAFTGEWVLNIPSQEVFFSNAFNFLTGAMLEEIMYRGIILTAMIHVWGKDNKGIIKAILVSSILFGASHLLNAFSAPAPEVLIQTIVVIIPAIFYAVCLRYGKSLWPPIVIHWLSNSVVNIQLATMESYEVVIKNWLISLVLLIPLLIFSLFLMRRSIANDSN